MYSQTSGSIQVQQGLEASVQSSAVMQEDRGQHIWLRVPPDGLDSPYCRFIFIRTIIVFIGRTMAPNRVLWVCISIVRVLTACNLASL